MRRNLDRGATRWPLLTLLIVAALAGEAFGDEPGVYSIECDLPASVVYNVSVTVEIPAGLVYLPESLAASGASSSPAVTTSGPTDGTGNLSLLLSFGTVNNSLDSDLLVEFVAVVADLPENTDGVTLPPTTASLSFDDGSGGESEFSGSIEPVSVVEPDLAIAKRATLEPSPGGEGETVAYAISIFHTENSHSGAFDVDVVESLPAGLSLVPGSAAIASGPAGSATEGGSAATAAAWHFDEIDQSWTESSPVVLTYRATVEDGSGAGAGGSGSGSESEPSGGLTSGPETNLTWTSTAGKNPQERSYSKTLVQGLSDLALTIECDSESVVVGKTITYTYTVDNLGLVTVFGLNLTDDRLGTISLDAAAASAASVLEPGETAAGVADYIVISDDLPGPLRNNATATGTDALGGAVSATAEISLPFGTDPLAVKKTALNKTVSRGDNITYKIEIYNTDTGPNAVSPTNIVVKDVFNRPVEFESASPPPDADGLWRYDKIDPGQSETITLVVKVPEEQDFEFTSESGVSGSGFVNVADDYSTSLDPYPLKNCVYVTFLNATTRKTETVSDCETVTVLGEAGTELSTREHGSGSYESADILSMQTETDMISLEKDMSAAHSTTTLGLYNGRTVTYTSPWTEEASAKNRMTGTSMSESYRYATSIDRDTRMRLDRNESFMKVESEFDGMGHIGFLKMPTNNSTFRDTPLFEVREDYSGSFKVLERVDEYGRGVSSDKSASGAGLVAVDKKVGESQRSYESGTGSYDSEEEIETYTNYIAKDISLVYAPAGGSSLRWKEGISSTTPGTSYIGEEYTGVTQLDKESVAKGLNELNTEASFSGRARYRAIYANASENATTTGKPAIDFDETYEGDYSIARKLLISGVPRYDRPHLNVTKTLVGIADETLPGAKETTLAGESRDRTIKVATYTITIENDGNRALAPINVRDLFPPGAIYLRSSLRPSSLSDSEANWTLTHLQIGGKSEIELELDVSKHFPDELVNRVEVCGGFGDEQVCAMNFSALEVDWLTCCPDGGLFTSKTGEVDPENGSVVNYRIEIKNLDNVTRVATVTDSLPDGMLLLDSSIPFASYDNDIVVWNVIEIGPSETMTIEYTALALENGLYTNFVEVDSRSVDGPVVQPVYAACVNEVCTVEDEYGQISGEIWQPPNWEFEHYGRGSEEATCEDLTCASWDGTDSYLAP
jgi:uncharacterized repeat protein (TIGR01451 family)